MHGNASAPAEPGSANPGPGGACYGVGTSDTPEGPFKYVGSTTARFPSAGDFDILVDDDGAATHDPPEKAPEPAKAADGEGDVDAEAESVGDTVAEAPRTPPVITVQDVVNRPSPPHEPFVEQARGAPIEDQFEKHWNATDTHFYFAGTWHPTWV